MNIGMVRTFSWRFKDVLDFCCIIFKNAAKLHKVEGKTKKLVSFFAETNYFFLFFCQFVPRTLLSFRAYFQFSSKILQGVKECRLGFGEDDIATGINPNSAEEEVDGTWFTLEGRRMIGRPTRQGLYINQGKKILVK